MLATTLSIVAVFLPIGFMGGIIGKFFHEFGITIVGGGADLDVRELHARPDALEHLARPGDRPRDQARERSLRPVTFYDKTIGRVTGWVDRATDRLAEAYQRHPALVAACTSSPRWAPPWHLRGQAVAMVPLLGTEFVPKADFSETTISFYTPVGSSLEVTEAKARQVEGVLREMPEVRYTLTTINTGDAKAQDLRQRLVRLVDRRVRKRSVDQMGVRCASAWPRSPASPSPMSACSTRWAATSRSRCRSRAPTWTSWSGSASSS